MLGGLLTMVGSAGTIVGNQVLATSGHAPLGVFRITPIGLLFVAVGVTYTLMARSLVPVRDGAGRDWAEIVAHDYTAEPRVHADSPLAGRPIREVSAVAAHDLTVVRVVRKGQGRRARGGTRLQADDGPIVVGPREGVTGLAEAGVGVGVPGRPEAEGGRPDPNAAAGATVADDGA